METDVLGKWYRSPAYQHLLWMSTTPVDVEARKMVTSRVGGVGREVTQLDVICVCELVDYADGAPGAKVSTGVENGVSEEERHACQEDNGNEEWRYRGHVDPGSQAKYVAHVTCRILNLIISREKWRTVIVWSILISQHDTTSLQVFR